MGAAIAGRKLNQAQPVARRHEAERLCIHGDSRTKVQPRREIIFVESDFH
jgi:hypothetical protein